MNPRQKSILVGAILGAGLGALGGYLFTRGLDMPREGDRSRKLSLQAVPPGDLVRVFIGIMAALRGVAELGERVELD
jgi:hypothetical protein